MNKLRKALDLDRDHLTELEKTFVCYSTRPHATVVHVWATNGVEWYFPWMHFICARREISISAEIASVYFSHHQLRIVGIALSDLFMAISEMSLVRVCSLPNGYCDAVDETVVINEIVIVKNNSDDFARL